MCVESDGCEIEGCSSSDEVRTLSGSMSPGLKSNPDLHPCRPGQKFRAALLKCRSPAAAAGILSFGNVLNYMDRYTVAEITARRERNTAAQTKQSVCVVKVIFNRSPGIGALAEAGETCSEGMEIEVIAVRLVSLENDAHR
uniref:Uncharacterized protein n=1 Tax=Astatotilapia calliptera TaxID=8154 RepID=A0AAX7T2R3_ASTCA